MGSILNPLLQMGKWRPGWWSNLAQVAQPIGRWYSWWDPPPALPRWPDTRVWAPKLFAAGSPWFPKTLSGRSVMQASDYCLLHFPVQKTLSVQLIENDDNHCVNLPSCDCQDNGDDLESEVEERNRSHLIQPPNFWHREIEGLVQTHTGGEEESRPPPIYSPS